MNKHSAVLITGGAARIGREIALHLAEAGYDIALHYNSSKAAAQKTASAIRNCKTGVSCELFKADLQKNADTQTLVARVYKKFPGLSVLVNNASVFQHSSLKKLNLPRFDQDFAIHVRAPYILTCEFARICKRGTVINLLDTHITKDKSSHFSYLLSKKALCDFTTMAAVELAPDIRVNAVAPGLVLAPATKGPEYLKRLSRGVPLKTTGNPKQIAQCIEFLLKNEYLTGQILFNDGGEHLRQN